MAMKGPFPALFSAVRPDMLTTPCMRDFLLTAERHFFFDAGRVQRGSGVVLPALIPGC